jgi:predicted DNA-binding antitoxin AbrB/MazE fold protein
MKYSFQAVFESGVFRPPDSSAIKLAEGQRVNVHVNDETVADPLLLATSVFDGLTAEQADEVERLALDRRPWFERNADYVVPDTLLDTDVLSGLMRKRPAVVARAQAYLRHHARLTIAAVTRFEILRGLKARQATTQLANFDLWCAASNVLPIRDAILVSASAIMPTFIDAAC